MPVRAVLSLGRGMANSRFLLVGLGNPGPEYHLSRHNAGFLLLDRLAEAEGIRIETEKMRGLYGQGRLFDSPCLLLKPQTYMNRSGECVRAVVDYFKIDPDHLLVLHDDIDLAPGRIRVVRAGGTGGHNGIRSLERHLGSLDFARIKIGVGRPERNEAGQGVPVDRFVLSRMSEDELAPLIDCEPLVQEAVELFIREGLDRCMNRVNRRPA